MAVASNPRRRKECSPETRHKISAAIKKRWQDREYRAKQEEVLRNRSQSAEYRKKLSAASKMKWQNPEYRAHQVAALRGREISPEARQKISAALSKRWQHTGNGTRQPAKRGRARGEAKPKPASLPGAIAIEGEPRHISTSHISTSHIEYLKSGGWQCPRSPTGAHHWIITGETMRCKYCPEERRIKR